MTRCFVMLSPARKKACRFMNSEEMDRTSRGINLTQQAMKLIGERWDIYCRERVWKPREIDGSLVFRSSDRDGFDVYATREDGTVMHAYVAMASMHHGFWRFEPSPKEGE